MMTTYISFAYRLQRLLANLIICRSVIFDPEKREEITNKISTNPKFKGTLFRSLAGTLYNNQLHFNETKSLICKEIFLTIPVVIYFPKNFYLKNAVNHQLEFLHAGGLIYYWDIAIYDERYRKVREDKHPRGMNIHGLSGCFYIYIITCCIACVAFVAEVVAGRGKSQLHKSTT